MRKRSCWTLFTSVVIRISSRNTTGSFACRLEFMNLLVRQEQQELESKGKCLGEQPGEKISLFINDASR